MFKIQFHTFRNHKKTLNFYKMQTSMEKKLWYTSMEKNQQLTAKWSKKEKETDFKCHYHSCENKLN